MPVVAIASIAAGATSLAAGGLTLFQTIAAIGGIVGGIGGLTKSKELMILGGIAGAVGGIGAFAQSQGWIAGSNAAAGADAVSNTEALMQTPAPGLENVNPTDARLATGTQTTPMESALDAATGTATTGLDTSIQQAMTQQSPAAQAMGAGPSNGLMNSVGPAVEANPTDLRLAAGTQATPMGNSGSVFDTIKSFGRWMEENKTLSQIGASFVGGMFDPKGKYYEDMAELEKRRSRNASDVPRLNPRLKQNGAMFPTGRPTYTLPRVGLMNSVG